MACHHCACVRGCRCRCHWFVGKEYGVTARAEWPTVMLMMSAAISTRSRDETTKVGAVVAGPDWNVLGSGFNGNPRGAPDADLPTSGSARHVWVVHAEVNSMLHAAMASGGRLEGCRLFSTHRACEGCLKMAAHLGIKEATYLVDELSPEQRERAETVATTLGIKVAQG